MANDTISRSWFCVLNNPRDHGYTGSPQEICEKLRDEWISIHADGSGAWAYCISATGVPHVHMVLEDKDAMRFSEVKKAYAVGMHFEFTKGTKAQAEAYITKQPPYDEAGEIVSCLVRHGEIRGRQGKRTDLEEIKEMIDAGMTPSQIFDAAFSARRYEKIVYAAYWHKRSKETPTYREIAVHYVFGPAGSGKSYGYVQLCEKLGEQNVYLMTDYSSNGGAGLDQYLGQRYLFMDELRDGLKYSKILQMLQGYKQQYHARFSNGLMLWEDVTITSVYAPEELFALLVPTGRRDIDSYEQLRRRLTDVTYCFRLPNGEYCKYKVDAAEYQSRDIMIASAHAAFETGAERFFPGQA